MSDPYAWIISIHAPRAGGDLPFIFEFTHSSIISIHAPRAGGDHMMHKGLIWTL